MGPLWRAPDERPDHFATVLIRTDLRNRKGRRGTYDRRYDAVHVAPRGAIAWHYVKAWRLVALALLVACGPTLYPVGPTFPRHVRCEGAPFVLEGRGVYLPDGWEAWGEGYSVACAEPPSSSGVDCWPDLEGSAPIREPVRCVSGAVPEPSPLGGLDRSNWSTAPGRSLG
jgi:hypothetical protein